MQAHTVNYNINFTYNYTDVAYMYYGYQDYNASASCEGCSLNDTFVGINRYPDTASAGAPCVCCGKRDVKRNCLPGLTRIC